MGNSLSPSLTDPLNPVLSQKENYGGHWTLVQERDSGRPSGSHPAQHFDWLPTFVHNPSTNEASASELSSLTRPFSGTPGDLLACSTTYLRKSCQSLDCFSSGSMASFFSSWLPQEKGVLPYYMLVVCLS